MARQTVRPRLSASLVELARDVRPLVELNPRYALHDTDSSLLERLILIGIDTVEREAREVHRLIEAEIDIMKVQSKALADAANGVR